MIESTGIRLALLGTGGFGLERARAMAASPKVDFVACYAPDEEARLACASRYGAQVADAEDTIWNDPSIHGVILATPNHLHLEQALRAAAAGKHLFIEKPITPTVSEAQELAVHARSAGIVVMVGHNTRRRSAMRSMKRMIDAGDVGQPVAVEANNSHAGGLTIHPGDWRWWPANCPGGPLIQLGIHHADTLQYLLGPVARVTAWQRRLATPALIDDTTVTLLEFEQGALGYLGSHYVVPDRCFVDLLGTRANLRWDREGSLVLQSAGQREELAVVPNDTIQEEIDEFARCVATGATPEVGLDEAIRALAVVEGAILSNQRGRPVEIRELLS